MKQSSVVKVFVSVLLAALVLSLAAPMQALAQQGQDGKVRVWVQFQPGARGNVEQALQAAGGEVHYAFDELNAFAVTVPAAALNGLQRNPNVVLVEEDAPRFPIGIEPSAAQVQPQVTLAGQTVPYGIDMVQARAVWDANNDGNIDSGAPTGAGRKICVIDSGIYTAHEDLNGENASGYNGNLAWNSDGSGHGTHVSGTIAAMNNALGVLGVTPGTVSIYMVRVFGDDGAWAYSSTLVDAANRCKTAGANVISMSLGGTLANRTEQTAFDNLNAAGILSIAAAGNDGNTRTSYPAGYASVMSVAAVDSTGAVATFSQQNADVEIAAPGVGVLSTVPYVDASTITVGSTTYSGGHIEFSARGSASGALADGGLCDATNGAWAGKVVLCQRGTIAFLDKVLNVQNSGGAAAVIYNNVSGGFSGTLGDGNSSTIVAISLSQEDGAKLLPLVGQNASVSSSITQPASGYEYYDGTSMATPHVSAVAALVWSANPAWTNQQVRDALTSTAKDLGPAGRDNAYGFGLVQAKAALDKLKGGGTTGALVVTVTTDKTSYTNRQTAQITTTVKDQNGAAVSGATVAVKITNGSGATVASGSCTTASTGACTVSWKVDTRKAGTGTFTATSTASKSGYAPGSGSKTFTVQ